VPWQGHTIVGTSYEPAQQQPSDPLAFLDEAAQAFPWAGIERRDVSLVHEGLVPGRGDAAGLSTRARLHDHEAEDGLPGLVSVQGVKFTTARAVAERAIDLVARRLARPLPACRTALTALARAQPLEGALDERTRQGVQDEMALTLTDAVLRRLDLGTAGAPAPADVDTVLAVMAGALGWDGPRIRAERASLAAAFPP
jgi:glycerol-3-phosphate dehydrogenase